MKKENIWVATWLLEQSVFGFYDSLLQRMKFNGMEGYF